MQAGNGPDLIRSEAILVENQRVTWQWERTDVSRSGAAGDISKLFKNEGTKSPGVFAAGAPDPIATLMAREVIQNSWDAARELRSELLDGAPDFEIEFQFADLNESARSTLIDKFDLANLAAHLHQTDAAMGNGSRTKIGLGSANVLDRLDALEPVRVLTITERGTTGMYGPFVGQRSKLYLALISIGYTMKAAGAGGSYGYGKAGLIGASATRTLVAYTCFRERDDDPGVTRRLIGMTYWGPHQLADGDFTGFARFGKPTNDSAIPFVNEEADAVAKSLGINLRHAANTSDLGTTFLVLEPEVDPHQLGIAIARNWWPAMLEDSFHPSIRVISATGAVERIEIRPRKDPLLKTFIRGWELATTKQDNNVATDFRKDLGEVPDEISALKVGWLGLHADLASWSYMQFEDESDEADEDVRHSSLVALVRGPRMVVEYLTYAKGKQPYVRGVFVASDDIDDLLRQTEPKAHDAWETTSAEDGVDQRAPKVARLVTKRIKDSVKDFQKKIKPPAPDPGDIRLPVFQQLFKKLMGSGPGPTPPPKGERDVSVHIENETLEESPGGLIRYAADISFALSHRYLHGDVANVSARLVYRFLEDGKAGEKCGLNITAPSEFTETAIGEYRGLLGRARSVFRLTTDFYDSDWTGRITANCVVEKCESSPVDMEIGGQ